MTDWYQKNGTIVTVNVYVQPGAKSNEVVGLYDGSLKIRLSSPPIEGRANQALLKYMANLFEVPLRDVTLKRGDKTRRKVVVITNSSIDPEVLIQS